jgi:competence protein ComEC
LKKILCIILTLFLSFVLISGCSSTPDSAQPGVSAEPSALESTASGNLKVHYIYVGQGDSEFIEFPDGQTMLIDAGPAEQGANVVNYIKKLGYTKIDYVVGTHPHTDHIGGLIDVLQSFEIGSMYMPSATSSIKTYTDLVGLIHTKGIPLAVAKKDVVIKPGFATIIAPVNENSKDMNDNSAVVKVAYQNTNFLFMGDASKNVEQELQDVSADVIKVGNHGSSYASSPEFITKVKPKIAVITCGKSNKYNLPNAATLKTLLGVGAKIYETSENGTITVVSDGTTVTADKEPVPEKTLSKQENKK